MDTYLRHQCRVHKSVHQMIIIKHTNLVPLNSVIYVNIWVHKHGHYTIRLFRLNTLIRLTAKSRIMQNPN